MTPGTRSSRLSSNFDEDVQEFHGGASRVRDVEPDASFHEAYRAEEVRIRSEHPDADIRRVVLEGDLEVDGRERDEDVEVLTPHWRGEASVHIVREADVRAVWLRLTAKEVDDVLGSIRRTAANQSPGRRTRTWLECVPPRMLGCGICDVAKADGCSVNVGPDRQAPPAPAWRQSDRCIMPEGRGRTRGGWLANRSSF